MFKSLITWYNEKKLEREFIKEFERKKKELIKLDPFIYEVPSDEKD